MKGRDRTFGRKERSMASVQFDGGKCHGAGEAKAMLRHADKDERLRHSHSNEDIDKARTPQNSDLHGLSYREMCKRYDRAISDYQQQAKRAIRKDAVTLYDAIITVPKDLPADREDDWYRDVEKTINDHYGKAVVLDIKIHRDEIHEYTDPATKQKVMSRTHGHCFMFPDVDGKLNAKKFSSRANMRGLNREIDAMTRDKYHVQFLTGEKAVDRGFQTVEQLKRVSDNAELLRQTERNKMAAAEARKERIYEQKFLERTRERIETETSHLDALQASIRALSAVEVAQIPERVRVPLFGLLGRNNVLIDRETLDDLCKNAAMTEEATRRYVEISADRVRVERQQPAEAKRLRERERKLGEREAARIVDRAREQAGEYYDLRREVDHYHRLEERYPEEFADIAEMEADRRQRKRKRDRGYGDDMERKL
jgi:hypothetical protein